MNSQSEFDCVEYKHHCEFTVRKKITIEWVDTPIASAKVIGTSKPISNRWLVRIGFCYVRLPVLTYYSNLLNCKWE